MAKTVSYEIYSFKNGNWMLDSVHDDKGMAVHQGRMLIASPHHMAIRVVQESYDDETDNSTSKIIYKDQKGEDDKARKPAGKNTKSATRKGPVKKKQNKKKKGNKTLMILVLSLVGISIGLLAFIGILIAMSG